MQPSIFRKRGFIRIIAILACGIILFVFLYRSHVAAPAGFPNRTTFTIEKGESLSIVATHLAEQQLVRSSLAFKFFMFLFGGDRRIATGDYYFEKPISTIEVAMRIAGRDFGILQQKVVFPEGFTNKDMAKRLAATFTGFDQIVFLGLAKEKEGYLFPDTYSFPLEVTPEQVVETLNTTFERKTAALAVEFESSKRTKKDIITMASIIEKEANGREDAYVIAGILWKRLDRGIALQVDAPFYYTLGKTSSQLTTKDLATKSPYNTYLNRGLPPTPIGNPGLTAIEAALRPEDSPYLYYLHDADGGVHYARTHDEHVENKRKFLK